MRMISASRFSSLKKPRFCAMAVVRLGMLGFDTAMRILSRAPAGAASPSDRKIATKKVLGPLVASSLTDLFKTIKCSRVVDQNLFPHPLPRRERGEKIAQIAVVGVCPGAKLLEWGQSVPQM